MKGEEMFEVDIRYYDEKGHMHEVGLVYVHNKEEAQKECDRISNEIGIECQVGAMIFID